MSERRIVIAGTGSGVGKTTVTIGLMAALMKKGVAVQGFKCGPDYMDPSYHTAVTKRVSRNLDSWMLSEQTNLDIIQHGSEGADVSIIEGVMGLFDGKSPETNEGSTAEISMLTQSPIILVVNCASMARSAAAIVKGFQLFEAGVHIVGVIANQVGSEGHFQLVKTAIEQECQIPVIGYLKREMDLEIPERSLGLIPSIERGDLDSFFDKLGELMLDSVDLDKLLEISEAPPLANERRMPSLFTKKNAPFVTIAVAKDAAFNAYYVENIELMKAYGAEIVYFSPLANEGLPEHMDGLYLGGNLPEEFVGQLAANTDIKQSITVAIENGIPTLAEGGGFMYLTSSIETTDQSVHNMVGVIPAKVHIHSHLKAIGYREIRGTAANYLLEHGQVAKGHEFHYTTVECTEDDSPLPYAYETKGSRGMKEDGYVTHNVVAGYPQFHFASCPEMVTNWLQKCLQVKKRK